MATRNLPADFLYRRIPIGILTEDVRSLLRAVVGGLQDQVTELRTLADQIQQLWDPANSVGEPQPVVIVTYANENGATDFIELNTNSTTPAPPTILAEVYTWAAAKLNVTLAQVTYVELSPSSSSTLYVWFTDNDGVAISKQPLAIDSTTPAITESTEFNAWCAAEAGVTVDQLISNIRSTDLARTAESRTLQLLADTVGAKLYTSISSGETVQNQKRALSSYFSRLKVKGTPLSFELAGRLHGFNDVKFTPLWGRVSPRNPSSVGASENDADFKVIPNGLPTPGKVTSLYDPDILNDGDVYTWSSGLLDIVENQTDYIITGINGLNPYVKVELLATPALLPVAGTYFLKGGANGIPARSDVVLAASSQLSNLRFEAIAPGPSFNGAQISIATATSQDGNPKVTVTVYHNLSTVKFRTSYFNLVAAAGYDKYAAIGSDLAQPAPDLIDNPSYWHDLKNLMPGSRFNFANDGVAVDPFRSWTGGMTPMPTVATWPDLVVGSGSGAIVARTQASAATPVLNASKLVDGLKHFSSNLDDVRPATRYPRKISTGLSMLTEVSYAPHIGSKLLASFSANGTYPCSAGTVGVDYPTLPFTGSFEVAVTVVEQNFTGGNWVDGDTTTTSYEITSESDPTDSNKVAFKFIYPVADMLEFTGSFDFSAATGSIIVTTCGGTVGAKRWLVTGSFAGLWEAIGTDRLQNETASARHYQPRPEDELELTYVYQLEDDTPIRPKLTAGGITIAANDSHHDSENALVAKLAPTIYALDESSKPVELSGVDSSNSDRGYVATTAAPDNGYGQRAVAFVPVATIPTPANQTQHSGPLSTVTTATLGTPYYVGSIRGVLVADPSVHWTKAHSEKLVGWWHCGEHPSQPYLLSDLSDLKLNQAELEAGGFTANYLLADRVWDTSRGWTLNLTGKTSSKAAGYFSITKPRLTGLDWTISFWLKAATVGSDQGENEILSYGPLSVKLGGYGTTAYLQFYAAQPDGTIVALGNQQPVSATIARHYSLSIRSLAPTTVINATTCAITNIAVLSGLQTIGGVDLAPGDTALLTGQTDAKTNGYYAVNSDNWYRLAVVELFDERLAYYQVDLGTNAGIYQCTTNGASWISYGTDSVSYAKYNCQWTGTAAKKSLSVLTNPTGNTATGLAPTVTGLAVNDQIYIRCDSPAGYTGLWTVSGTASQYTFSFLIDPAVGVVGSGSRSVQPVKYYSANLAPVAETDTTLTVSAPDYVGSPTITISDLRLWAKAKTPAELWAIENPQFKPVSVACRPTFISSTNGGNKALQVLPCGYVFPSVRPMDYYLEQLTQLVRYNSLGEYTGPDCELEVGLGNAEPAANPLTLGWQGTQMQSQGNHIAASAELDAGMNPTKNWIYTAGSDGLMYRVSLQVYRYSSTTDTPSLYARVASYSKSGELTDAAISATDRLNIADFYDLTAAQWPETLPQPEFLSDSATELAVQGGKRLTVTPTAGVPRVVQAAGGAATTPLLYLYSHAQNYLENHLPTNIASWLNPDSYGTTIGIPCRSIAGPISLLGSSAQLDTGKYRLLLDASSLGNLDSEFAGFDVEVSISAYISGVPTTSTNIIATTILPTGNSSFSIKYGVAQSIFRQANCKPGNYDQLASPEVDFNSTLQAAINELSATTGGAEVLIDSNSGYPSVIGGPYWVRFVNNGAKDLFTFETTTGLTAMAVREIAGDANTKEVQKITLYRPLAATEFDISTPILSDGTHSWTVQVYLTNPLVTATTVRRLAIHQIWLYRISSQLYQVSIGAVVPQIDLVAIDGSSTPGTKPGGFVTKVTENGIVTYSHEKDEYATISTLGDATANTDLPAADLLTGSTADKIDSIIINRGDQPDDAAAPSELPDTQVKLLINNSWPLDPDSPQLETLIELGTPTQPN